MFIHELSDWPALHWDAAALAREVGQVQRGIGHLLGRMSTLGIDLQQQASLAVLTSDVLQTSAIEGEALPPDEVRSSLARRLGLDVGGLPQAGRDVEGIVELMLDATQQPQRPLTRARLFDWHAGLFPTGRSATRRITVGAWRTAESGPMQVVSGPIGRETVHFEAPPSERLDAEMDRFLQWFNEPGDGDPLLRAGAAHLWFVTIHPFEDGNGRIARAIADLQLARSDQAAVRCYSMSSQIAAERSEYYRQLETAQRGGLDITAWQSWFVGCLQRALVAAERIGGEVLHKADVWQRLQDRPVNARQKKVLNKLLDGFDGNLTNARYARMAHCSSDTALRDIRLLLEWGVLLRNEGGGRSTSYRLA